jgi:hypothetical protein
MFYEVPAEIIEILLKSAEQQRSSFVGPLANLTLQGFYKIGAAVQRVGPPGNHPRNCVSRISPPTPESSSKLDHWCG